MRDAPTTVLEAIEQLEWKGFTGSFSMRGAALVCGTCGAQHTTATVDVVRVFRFEGPSDPDEEAVVYGLVCPVCSTGGTLVSSFGPGADPELADVLVMLDERFRPG